jgi:hypothetical protein
MQPDSQPVPAHRSHTQLAAAVIVAIVAIVALAAILLLASLQPAPEPNVVLAFATASNEGCFGGMTTYNYSFTIVNPRASDVRVGVELYADNTSTGISYFYLGPKSSQAS